MKVFSIRVPDEVCDKLKSMSTKYVRQRLIEIAGFTYREEEKLEMIEDIVKRFVKENIGKFEIKEQKADHELTNKAMDTILGMIQ